LSDKPRFVLSLKIDVGPVNMIASSKGKEPVHVGLETARPRSRRRPKPTADVPTSLSAVNTSNHSSNDPGQRGAVALTDHELTEFAQLTPRGL